MKKVKIYWNKEIFDGLNRLLPNTNQLYSHITIEGRTWTLCFNFSVVPILQGYITEGEVRFLMEEAPHEVLQPNFEFNFLDGQKVVGKCTIFSTLNINITSILEEIEEINKLRDNLIDKIKHLNLKHNEISYDNQELSKLIKYSDEYLAIFPLVVKLNKEIAEGYLKEKMFEWIRMYSKSPLMHPYIPNFLYYMKEKDSSFFNNLPDEIKNNNFFNRMLNDI